MDPQTSTMNGENTSQNNQLTERKKIPGTPFHIIKQSTNHDPLMDEYHVQYFLVMGDYRITEPEETEKDAFDKLITDQWLIITNIIAIAVQKMTQKEEKPYELESL